MTVAVAVLSRFLGRRRYRTACRHLERERPARAIRPLRRAAEAGHEGAQASLGEAYRVGRGVMRDPTEAAHWLRLAAGRGVPNAQFSLARVLLDPVRLPACNGRWLEAEGRDPALCELLFPRGISLGDDRAEATRWLREASRAGHAGAQAQLAWLLAADHASDPGGVEAFALFQSAAAAGVAEAHYGLGRCHELGRGTEPDDAKATFAYKAGAEVGHVPAQFRLGLALRDGKGVEADGTAARLWLERAMQGGSGRAAFELGKLLLSQRNPGTPVAPELAEAAETALRRAVRHEHAPALLLLASLLASGTVLARSEKEAALLYRRAAETGDTEACFIMGRLSCRGEGVRLDLAAARRWYERAADGGHAVAAFNLAVLHQKGLGGPIDGTAAARWYRVAAAAGLAPAHLQLGRLRGEQAGNGNERCAAFRSIERAAADGSLEARRVRRDMAFDFAVRLCREGGGADLAEARSWYERSAADGHLGASYNLAVMKLNGWGGPRDLVGARHWLDRAAARLHPEAQAALIRLDGGARKTGQG